MTSILCNHPEFHIPSEYIDCRCLVNAIVKTFSYKEMEIILNIKSSDDFDASKTPGKVVYKD